METNMGKIITLGEAFFNESGLCKMENILEITNGLETWILRQNEAKNHVSYSGYNPKTTRLIAGLDISYETTNQKDTTRRTFNGVAIVSVFEGLEVLVTFVMTIKTSVPYIKGALSLREAPVFVEMLSRIKKEHPQFYPDLLIVDGHGAWHAQHAGSTTMIGIMAKIPTIGIGKDFLEIEGVTPTKDEFKKIKQEIKNKGDFMMMYRRDDKSILGVVYNGSGTMNGTEVSNKAFTFISVGNMINIEDAIELVSSLMIHKICEPIRAADFASGFFYEKFFGR